MPTTCVQVNLMKAILQLRFPFPRYFKLATKISHHKTFKLTAAEKKELSKIQGTRIQRIQPSLTLKWGNMLFLTTTKSVHYPELMQLNALKVPKPNLRPSNTPIKLAFQFQHSREAEAGRGRDLCEFWPDKAIQ